MVDVFKTIYEEPHFKAHMQNFDADTKLLISSIDSIKSYFVFVEKMEHDFLKQTSQVISELKKVQSKLQFLNAPTKNIFTSFITCFEKVEHVQKAEVVKTADVILRNINLNHSYSLSDPLKKSREGIDETIGVITTDIISMSADPNLHGNFMINKAKYEDQTHSYFTNLQKFHTVLQTMLHFSISSFFSSLLTKQEKFNDVLSDHKKLLFDKNTLHSIHKTKTILDPEYEIFEPRLIYPIQSPCYVLSSFLLQKKLFGNPILLYGTYDSLKCRMVVSRLQGNTKPNDMDIRNCIGYCCSGYSSKILEFTVKTKKLGTNTYCAISEANAKVWVKGLGGKYTMVIPQAGKAMAGMKQGSGLREDTFLVILSQIESSSPDIYKEKSDPKKVRTLINDYDDKKIRSNTIIAGADACMLVRSILDANEKLIPSNVYENFISIYDDENLDFEKINNLIRFLPSDKMKILKLLFVHFNTMASKAVNREEFIKDLSIIFAPLIIDGNNDEDPVKGLLIKCILIQKITEHHDKLFSLVIIPDKDGRKSFAYRTFVRNDERKKSDADKGVEKKPRSVDSVSHEINEKYGSFDSIPET